MLTLILIDDQYVQNVVFSFEKSSNGQNHFSSDFQHSTKKSPNKISHCPNWGNPGKLANITTIFVYLFFFRHAKVFNKNLRADREI